MERGVEGGRRGRRVVWRRGMREGRWEGPPVRNTFCVCVRVSNGGMEV